MDIRFDGKRALVTGAGKGIGRSLAKKLVQCGAKTVALSRTQADLDSLKAECPEIETCLLDVSDWSKVGEAISSLGHFDLLVNNAAVMEMSSLLDVSEKQFDTMFNTNIKGLFRVSQIVAKSMVEAKTGGVIVNLSSLGSEKAIQGIGVYSSTKGAVDTLTRSMAAEWAKYKIRVNSVNPVAIRTPMAESFFSGNPDGDALMAAIPMGRCGEVHEVVDTVLFLLSDKASFISGVTLPIDGALLVV